MTADESRKLVDIAEMQDDRKRIYELEESQIEKLSMSDLTDYANALYLFAKTFCTLDNNLQVYFDLNRIKKSFNLTVDWDYEGIFNGQLAIQIVSYYITNFQHLLNLFFRLERRNSKFFKEHELDRIVLDSYARIREILGYKDLDASTFDLFSRLQQFCWNENCKVWNTPVDFINVEFTIKPLKKQLNKTI